MQRQISQIYQQANEETREGVERARETCERHYEACRERMREELLGEAARERERLTAQLQEAQESYLRLAEDKKRGEVMAADQLAAQLELTERRLAEVRSVGVVELERAVHETEVRAKEEIQVQLEQARQNWEREAAAAQKAAVDEAVAVASTAFNERLAQELEARRLVWEEEQTALLEQEKQRHHEMVQLETTQLMKDHTNDQAAAVESAISATREEYLERLADEQRLFQLERSDLTGQLLQLADENQQLCKKMAAMTVSQAEFDQSRQEYTRREVQLTAELTEMRSQLAAERESAYRQQQMLDEQRDDFACREEKQRKDLVAAQQQVADLKKREMETGRACRSTWRRLGLRWRPAFKSASVRAASRMYCARQRAMLVLTVTEFNASWLAQRRAGKRGCVM